MAYRFFTAISLLSAHILINEPNSSGYYETKFNETIQCLREKLAVGDPEAGIPPMDPLIFNDTIRLDIDNNKFFYSNLNLNDLIISGLLNFDVVSLNLNSTFLLEVHYHFKKVKITSLHGGDINLLGLMGLITDGDITLEILNTDIKTTTQYNVEPPLINDYTIDIEVGKINLQVTGLNDEELSYGLSKFVSAFGAKIINMLRSEISYLISPIIQRLLNQRIGHFTFLQFLEIIVNPTCEF